MRIISRKVHYSSFECTTQKEDEGMYRSKDLTIAKEAIQGNWYLYVRYEGFDPALLQDNPEDRIR